MGQIKLRGHVFRIGMISTCVDIQRQQLHCGITRTNHKLHLRSLETLRITELLKNNVQFMKPDTHYRLPKIMAVHK